MPNRQELLEPESWGEVLELYAKTVNIAVALLDEEGRMVGLCHNPQPIWTQAREARPVWGFRCQFCLDPDGHCTAVADAKQSHKLTVALGMGGFVHVAVPLFLKEVHVGTLLAGQVFYSYPELIPLEQVAREYGLQAQELWRVARQRIPVSRETMIMYGKLLGRLGEAFLWQRDSLVMIRTLADTNEMVASSNEELKDVNAKLSGKVAELDQSLLEKDILLNEVHHRVNNNLQVIASLLRMQAETFPDAQVADALRESQARVDSMALIHAQLYNSVDWSAVNFAEYVALLTGNLFLSYGIEATRVAWRVDVSPFKLSVDKAIPAGLILNELISNALKHAFPKGRRGTLLITGDLRDGRIELCVEDDGTGVMEKKNPGARQSLGLKIVDILIRQLKGTLERPKASMDGTGGAIFRISFPLPR